MDVLIVTGMSGAGKSQVVVALEDIGYYCVDNVPPMLIGKFTELSTHAGGKIEQMALVVDSRSHQEKTELVSVVEELKEKGYAAEILFLACDSTVLANRYKETRRRHPLERKNVSIEEAIRKERVLLAEVRSHADYLVDTSVLSANQLRDYIRHKFIAGKESPMGITVTSFGFKYGAPRDVDLLFDVRGLINPYYILELRPQTGLDTPVEEYVMSFPEAQILLEKIIDFLDFTIPLYVREGKTNLTIGIGCTGGKHRSVTFAERIAKHLQQSTLQVTTLHRDIDRQ